MEFKLRQNLTKLEIGKSIEFICDYPNKFRGFLTYKRDFYNGYNVNTGDELDETILKEVANRFGYNTRFNFSALLLTENQEKQFLTITRGGLNKSISLYFYPLTDIETYKSMDNSGKLLYTKKEVQISLLSNVQENLDTFIYNEYIVAFDINEYDKLETFI